MTKLDHSSFDPNSPALGGCAIRLSVERRLQLSGYTALGRVCVEFQMESGVLQLRGAVSSYYLKQLAQELVVDLEGVRLVDNQINVARPARRGAAWNGERDDDADSSSEV